MTTLLAGIGLGITFVQGNTNEGLKTISFPQKVKPPLVGQGILGTTRQVLEFGIRVWGRTDNVFLPRA